MKKEIEVRVYDIGFLVAMKIHVKIFNTKPVLSQIFSRNVTLDSAYIASRCHACVTSSSASKDKKVSMGCKWKEVRRGNRIERIPSRYRHPIKGIERSCRSRHKNLYLYFNQRWQYDLEEKEKRGGSEKNCEKYKKRI